MEFSNTDGTRISARLRNTGLVKKSWAGLMTKQRNHIHKKEIIECQRIQPTMGEHIESTPVEGCSKQHSTQKIPLKYSKNRCLRKNAKQKHVDETANKEQELDGDVKAVRERINDEPEYQNSETGKKIMCENDSTENHMMEQAIQSDCDIQSSGELVESNKLQIASNTCTSCDAAIDVVEMFKCQCCDADPMSKSEILKHLQIHNSNVDELPLQCVSCSSVFAKKTLLMRHLKLAHIQPCSVLCEECKCVIWDGKNLFCKHCDGFFFDHHTLKLHTNTHKPSRFLCDICSDVFRDKVNLDQHRRSHLIDKPFECPECGRGFSHISNMRSHELTHTKEKRFKCSECSNFYSRMNGLRQHMKIHIGNNEFCCSTCNAKFIHKSSFERHLLTHRDEKKFSCKVCDNEFRARDNFMRHLKSRKHLKNAWTTMENENAMLAQTAEIKVNVNVPSEVDDSGICGDTNKVTIAKDEEPELNESNPEANQNKCELQSGGATSTRSHETTEIITGKTALSHGVSGVVNVEDFFLKNSHHETSLLQGLLHRDLSHDKTLVITYYDSAHIPTLVPQQPFPVEEQDILNSVITQMPAELYHTADEIQSGNSHEKNEKSDTQHQDSMIEMSPMTLSINSSNIDGQSCDNLQKVDVKCEDANMIILANLSSLKPPVPLRGTTEPDNNEQAVEINIGGDDSFNDTDSINSV